MRPIFRNTALQKQFDQNGFVVADIFSTEEVAALQKIYAENKIDETSGLQLTVKNNNFELNKKIHGLTLSITQEPIQKILVNYCALYAGFIAKLPHLPNVAGLHRDPSFTDETNYTSLVAWCALTDTTEKNGALYVVRNSNKFYKGFKSFNFGKYDFSFEEGDVQRETGTMVPLKKGQGIIYDTALLHFSYQNETNEIRLVHSSLLIPEEAKVICYHHNQLRNTVDTYEVDADFLLQYYQKYIEQNDLDAPLLNRFAFEPPIQISAVQLRKEYERVNPTILKKGGPNKGIKNMFEQLIRFVKNKE